MSSPAAPLQFRLEGARVRSLEIDALDVPARGAIAIQGPNGSGKSTLLQTLNLLLKPASGVVRFYSSDAWAPTFNQIAARRMMTLVMQEPYLFSTSVLENVRYGLNGSNGAREALDRWGMAPMADKPAKELSGGESKRLALARALALKREILMLDEPHEGLDAPGRAILDELLEKRSHGARLLLLATHDSSLALRTCDDVIYLRDGKRATVAPDNLFTGRASGTEFVTRAGAKFEIAERREGAAVAAVDPADVLLSTSPLTSSARNSFHGRIVALESLSEALVRVRVKSNAIELVAHITSRSAREMNVKPGDAVYATFKAASVSLS